MIKYMINASYNNFTKPIFLLLPNLKKMKLNIWLVIIVSLFIITTNYNKSSNIQLNEEDSKPIFSFATKENVNSYKTHTVQKGDIFGNILKEQNLKSHIAIELINLLDKENISSKLQIGQNLIFEYKIITDEATQTDVEDQNLTLNRLNLILNKQHSIKIIRNDNNKFELHHVNIPLIKKITRYDAVINSNVVTSLKQAGLDDSSIIKLINAYSHQIDFQKQIKTGDKVHVIIEKFETENTEFSHFGRILYASIITQGSEYKIYNYSPDGKEENARFFSEEGNSLINTRLINPLNVARVSSHFGYRKKHPVLGYGAMHKGVDFFASIGTPILAAGSGVVTFIGQKPGYGRFITIKHTNSLVTAYAHASKFAKNLKRGSKVGQGQVIAFSGRSGRVTAPHLHYEVRVNGKPVNPLRFKSPPETRLAGAKLKKFRSYKDNIAQLNNRLIKDDTLFAKAADSKTNHQN